MVLPQAIRFTKFVGKWTLCAPLAPTDSKSAWTHKTLHFFQVLVAFWSTILYLDSIITNDPATFAVSDKPTILVASYILYLAIIIPDLLVRCGNLLICRAEFQQLDARLRTLSGSEAVGRRVKIIAWMGLCVLWCLLAAYNFTMFAISYRYSDAFRLTLLPRNDLIIPSAYAISQLLCALSLFYATLYVVIFGIALIEKLKNYTVKFQNSVRLGFGSLRGNGEICSSSSSRSTPDTQALLEEFKGLKIAFENYGNVAGIFCLGIFVHLAMCIVCFLGGVKTESESQGKSIVWLWVRRIQYSSYLIYLPLLANFGHWMSTEVTRCQSQIREIDVDETYRPNQKLSKLANWIGQWKWKLTAFHLFDVDRSLVPAVGAVVMSYFIFLLQLKASERDNGIASN